MNSIVSITQALATFAAGVLALTGAIAGAAPIRDGSRDFDFLIGQWDVHHHVLRNQSWVDFDGTTSARLVMDGTGNVDDNVLRAPAGTYHAVTVRMYEATTHDWYIRWHDSRIPAAPVDPPMRGRFVDSVGTFFADDTSDGKPIRVRFRWSQITATSCHWDQAISHDGGTTWDTNYTMEFTRVAP